MMTRCHLNASRVSPFGRRSILGILSWCCTLFAGAMVTDEPAGEADQDWRKGRQPWPLRDLPGGRGRSVAAHVQAHRDAYCPASGAARISVRGARIECQRRQECAMTRQSNKFYAGRGGNSSISAARGNSSQLGLLPWTPENTQWRSPVPQSEEKLFLNVNYLTLLDRFLNDGA